MGEVVDDPRGDAAWTDPAKPPTVIGRDLRQINDVLWVVWLADESHPHLWHWCDRSVQNARIRAENGEPVGPDRKPGWSLAGTGAHDLISVEPLHLEPSLHLPDCCGLHGFIRGGAWTSA